MQLENKHRGLGLFGTADDIAVQRGIAEFQAGRPVLIEAHGERLAAFPVDGLTQGACDAFRALCAPAEVGLVVTARRAGVSIHFLGVGSRGGAAPRSFNCAA